MKDVNSAAIVFKRKLHSERDKGRVPDSVNEKGERLILSLRELDQAAARTSPTGSLHRSAMQSLDEFEEAWHSREVCQQQAQMNRGGA